MKHDPAPIKGQDLFKVLYGSTFKFDRSLIPGEVDALTAKIEKEYAEGKMRREETAYSDHRMSNRRSN